MKKNIIIWSILFLTGFIPLLSAFNSRAQRNLVILNSQNDERIGSSKLAFSSCLLAALHQKSVPILVSTGIWRNFIERKEEFALRSKIPTTKESKLRAHHQAVMNALNQWTKFFQKQTPNFADVKLLVTEQINEEFCNQTIFNQLQDEKLLPQDNNDLYTNLNFYLFDFNPADWDVYRVTDFYYLFIPKAYVESLRERTDKTAVSVSSYDELVGFKIGTGELLANPLDSSLINFEPVARPEGDFMNAIECIFGNQSPKNQSNSYRWSIFLGGHGYNMEPVYPNNNEKFELINNLSVKEFKQLLSFLNNNLITNVFAYLTCYGAGEHLYDPYQTNGQADRFNFPIIVTNLSDVPSYTFRNDFIIPTLEQTKCNLDYYEYDSVTQVWSLKFISYVNFKKFFNAINRIDVTNQVEKLSDQALWRHIIPDFIETQPNIRPCNATEFMIYQSPEVFKISPLLVFLKQHLQLPLYITDYNYILIESPVVSMPLITNANNLVPFSRIISVLPGSVSHYFEKIEARHYYALDILKGFWPLALSCFNKKFLINELIMANNPDSPEAIMLNATQDSITLYEVLIQIEGDYLIRVYFKTQEGTYYSCHVRYMEGDKDPSINSVVVMSPKAVEKYTFFYKATKKELIEAFTDPVRQASLEQALKQLAVVSTSNVSAIM